MRVRNISIIRGFLVAVRNVAMHARRPSAGLGASLTLMPCKRAGSTRSCVPALLAAVESVYVLRAFSSGTDWHMTVSTSAHVAGVTTAAVRSNSRTKPRRPSCNALYILRVSKIAFAYLRKSGYICSVNHQTRL